MVETHASIRIRTMPTPCTLSLNLPIDTDTAIARWAAALPAPSYLVTATNIAGVEVWRRWWPADLLRVAAGWLRATAEEGAAIGARPWLTTHVLVRGLRPAGYARLAEHHRIAAAIEPATGLIEAWITIAEAPVDVLVAARTAAVLAARYGGDLLRANAGATGHLPGLPNVVAAPSTDSAPTTRLLIAGGPVVDATAAAIMQEQARMLGRPAIWQGRTSMARPERSRPAMRTRRTQPTGHRVPSPICAWPPAFLRRGHDASTGQRAGRSSVAIGGRETHL
ncbi:hypothetical protein [Falsiroseomonas sp. CW058]|uniref:hypothetical protein n=1 Tax=Falsiroseomonas sp. CW058 TaxID=3388664 RepID=UPI003D3238AC